MNDQAIRGAATPELGRYHRVLRRSGGSRKSAREVPNQDERLGKLTHPKDGAN